MFSSRTNDFNFDFRLQILYFQEYVEGLSGRGLEREDFPKRVAHLSALLHALRDALQLLVVPHPALQEDEPRVLGFRVDAH